MEIKLNEVVEQVKLAISDEFIGEVQVIKENEIYLKLINKQIFVITIREKKEVKIK
jgi:hypothetical protein